MSVRAILIPFFTVLTASPALAQSAGSVVPEPSSVALFGLGIAGLVIGRHFSGRRPKD
ncbi:MAG: PEP-CTERM sorting domain-containing protein [Sphingomonadales bacterium]|nr:PEP-CTERM sorting domain-containing protein [Sphingomonadales bacterium]